MKANDDMSKKIMIETVVPVSTERAWEAFTRPEAITKWNFASSDWCCPDATVDLRVGGRHVARMEATDGSMGFDYAGVYEEVSAPSALTLRLDDGRLALTTFEVDGAGARVRTVFDPDPANPVEMQGQGWQAILDNYSAFVARELEG